MNVLKMLVAGNKMWTRKSPTEKIDMVWPINSVLTRIGLILVNFAASCLTIVDASFQIPIIFLHRLVVAIRETAGQKPFDSLSKVPRHICLVIGRPSRVPDIDRAVRTILGTGVERVTICHDGSSSLSCESYTECVTKDMGKSAVIESIQNGYSRDEVSHPDSVLILGSSSCPLRFSLTAIQLPKCVDASLLYYSELVPLYSLNPSDVYLAVTMFQSKSQRFGR